MCSRTLVERNHFNLLNGSLSDLSGEFLLDETDNADCRSGPYHRGLLVKHPIGGGG